MSVYDDDTTARELEELRESLTNEVETLDASVAADEDAKDWDELEEARTELSEVQDRLVELGGYWGAGV